MNSETSDKSAEATREAFRALPTKQRMGFLKKVAGTRPRTIREVLLAAHISASFQPARIDRWLQAEQQQRLEQVILGTEHELWFEALLRGFFCHAHGALNDRLLGLTDPASEVAVTFEQALTQVGKEFRDDPYVKLYDVAIRWVCRNTMTAHAELLRQKWEGCQSETSEHSAQPPEPSDCNGPTVPDFASLDTEVSIVNQAVSQLHASKICDLATASTAFQRANTVAKELAGRLATLASEAGEETPPWSTREEFIASWRRLAAAAEAKRSRHLHTAETVAEIVRLLETAEVRHRLPRRQVELTALARRAGEEVKSRESSCVALLGAENTSAVQSASPVKEPHTVPTKDGDPAVDSGQRGHRWLQWAWSQEGPALESLQQAVQAVSPTLADLLGATNWADLRWGETATVPPTAESLRTQVPSQAERSSEEPPPSALPTPVVQSPQSQRKETGSAPQPCATEESPSPPQVRETSQAAEPPAGGVLPPAPASAASTTPTKDQRQTTGTPPAPAPLLTPPVSEPPAQVAEEALSVAGADSLAQVVWRLVREGRWGLAGHLASLDDTRGLPPAWVFHAAALGPRVNYEVSPVSQLLASAFTESSDFHLEHLPEDVQRVTRLLVVGAALRPALLAPLTGAHALLSRLQLAENMRLPHLGAMVGAITAFSQRGEPLQPGMLQGSRSQEEWQRQLLAVRAEIRDWLSNAPNYGFNYALAARIWRAWTGPGGALRRLLDRTSDADATSLATLRRDWKPWSSEGADLVQEAIQRINQRMTVVGAARDKLLANIGQAVDLAERVFVLLASSPERNEDFRQEQAQRLCEVYRSHRAAAERELDELSNHQGRAGLEGAARFCREAVVSCSQLLDGDVPVPGASEPEPRWLIEAELLRGAQRPVIAVGPLFQPQLSDRDRLLVLASSVPDWPAAWAQQTAAENHVATAALLEFSRWQPVEGVDTSKLVHERHIALEECQARVGRKADDTRRLLDEFVGLGLCREKDYNDWSAAVESVRREAEEAVEFAPLRARLVAVDGQLRQQLNSAAEEVRRRLSEAKAISLETQTRIAALLDQGDIHTANDYLALAIAGRPLPEAVYRSSEFDAFFGERGWLTRTEREIREASFQELAQAARSGDKWHGLDFQMLSVDQREQAVAHLQLWFTLERQRRADEAQVRDLAIALGLRSLRIVARTARTSTYVIQPFDSTGETFSDRSQVLVPAFGSEARGAYRLHFVWGDVDMDDLLTDCRAGGGDTSGHLVVCFRPLGARDRRELADEARNKMFKAAVVDRALFLFLCAQPGARLATLLRCALPFTRVEPYSVAAGEVPPEMFFGRTRELDSLADPRGSCFVYGGRQLGKTALLRALERSFHLPTEGRVAIYMDLERELRSRGRPMDDLWPLLLERLQEKHVLSDERIGAGAGPEAFIKHIKNWLGGDTNRRLLVLLDEADEFLVEDGKEIERQAQFSRVRRLKGLMEDTKRRFKVVFAGLHNVQRTARVIPNQPLAHLGEALCIGPMIEKEESRAARELVEQPLADIGYVFESPDVVSRILAWTNYYPNLIQLFCYYLLRDLRDNHVARFPNRQATPPCRITSQHVQAAYTRVVRQAIHEKVSLTLELDPRYKLTAYLLAYYHVAEPSNEGVELRDIRAEAASFWPSGFSDMRTDDEFRVLLEEMVGLGVLRQVGGSRFALRNPNVMMLLGTSDEIDRRLQSAKDWELARKYETDKFRRVLEDGPQVLLSPLTAQQESEIRASENRVVVLYGLPAAGLSHLPAAIESLFGKKNRTSLSPGCASAADLDEVVRKLDRPQGTNTVLVVSAETNWDESWVAVACHRIGQLVSKSAFVTILFVAGPTKAMQVVSGLDGARELGVREITLRPWHDAAVRQWLQDLNVTGDRDLRDAIRSATGYWPELLARLRPASVVELKQSCEELRQALGKPEDKAALRVLFALEAEDDTSPLHIAADLREFSVEDICQLLDIVAADGRQRVGMRLRWAERLGLITPGGTGKFQFDPVAANALQNALAS
jgi:hypothetical protein